MTRVVLSVTRATNWKAQIVSNVKKTVMNVTRMDAQTVIGIILKHRKTHANNALAHV